MIASNPLSIGPHVEGCVIEQLPHPFRAWVLYVNHLTTNTGEFLDPIFPDAHYLETHILVANEVDDENGILLCTNLDNGLPLTRKIVLFLRQLSLLHQT